MFGFKKKSQQKTQKQTERIESEKSITYKQSHSFRGFKRIKLSSYGNKESLDGIAAFTDKDISEATITVRVIKGENSRAEVYVEGQQVGTVWADSGWAEYYEDLKNNRVDKVMVRIEDGESYLFIHRAEAGK